MGVLTFHFFVETRLSQPLFVRKSVGKNCTIEKKKKQLIF